MIYNSTAYALHEVPVNPRIKLIFEGAFLTEYYDDLAGDFISFYVSHESNNGNSHNVSQLLTIPIAEVSQLDTVSEIERSKTIYLDESVHQSLKANQSVLKVNLMAELPTSFPMGFTYDPAPLNKDVGIILAAVVLLGLYVLIVLELVHRTFAAIIASSAAIGTV